MKERPILFSAPMVRALLDGSKTQTRRVVKNPYMGDVWTVRPAINPRFNCHTHDWWLPDAQVPYGAIKCHYGQPGDRLWVRETFARNKWAMGYRADGSCGCWGYDGDGNRIFNEHGRLSENAKGFVPTRYPHVYGDRWIPSIHMPREASRIDLEITGVRVERLQDISEADAKAEGIESAFDATRWRMYDHRDGEEHSQYVGPRWTIDPVRSYRSLWLSINGAGSWDENPWVWCISFKVIKPQQEFDIPHFLRKGTD